MIAPITPATSLDSTAISGCEQGLVVHLRVLRLTLKRRWFDMIASGEKREEFREQGKWIDSRVNANKEYDVVEFKNGYGPNVPTCVVEYRGYDWATGNPAWGAEPGKRYKVIYLGRVLSLHNAEVSDAGPEPASNQHENRERPGVREH